jgi:hypothetical protein
MTKKTELQADALAKACASMEFAGVPIDTATLALLLQHWDDIQDELIGAIVNVHPLT